MPSPCGVVLETLGSLANDKAAHARWHALISRMALALAWPTPMPSIKVCVGTSMLAFVAPVDLLLLATDVNEWAWEVAVGLIGLGKSAAPSDYAQYDAAHGAYAQFDAALAVFLARAQAQARPDLLALLATAGQRQLTALLDDENLTLGTGSGAQTWPLTALPSVAEVAWASLSNIASVLVSGTNGKTTSVRLVAAFASQAGLRAGYCCTEGVFINGSALEAGDYSGPAGARSVLRHQELDFAVLEVARGGILRRGLALASAPVALLTNVSPEHFGEYGVDNLQDLADVKLVLAQALGVNGSLVLNADDPVLLPRVSRLVCKVALFALDYAHPALQALRLAGGACCGVQAGRLCLFLAGKEYDLGEVAAMPLTIHGTARYNIANLAGAALAAALSHISVPDIAQVLAGFGASRFDNPGRLERWALPGVDVLLDYAHNPEGLQGLLEVARGLQSLRGNGRMGLLLGQAGNRSNSAIADLAAMAASFQPDHIILKDILGYMRGRVEGEVPALLCAQLLASNIPAQRIETILPEVDAALAMLRWANTGDVLVLPVHDSASKTKLRELLDALQAQGWQCGQALPLPLPISSSLSSPLDSN